MESIVFQAESAEAQIQDDLLSAAKRAVSILNELIIVPAVRVIGAAFGTRN